MWSLPLALPGVVATGIFTFILAWNDYIFARVLLSADELKTLPVGIADLYNASVVDWGMIMAAGLLVLAPVLAVFVFIQKSWWLVGALAASKADTSRPATCSVHENGANAASRWSADRGPALMVRYPGDQL